MSRVDEIGEAIRQAIANGEFLAGSFLPTERELQLRFAASRSTLRRALAEVVASGWGKSQPSRGVQVQMGRREPKSALVAFVDYTDWVHKSLFFCLSQFLAERGFHLAHVDSTSRGTMGALEHAADSGFAAAVFWGKDMFLDPERFAAVEAKMPVVAVDHCPNGINADVVMGDHFGGARQAVGHLFELGRKRIALSGFMTMVEDARQRMLGYAAAHQDHEVLVLAHNIVFSAPTIDWHDEPRLLAHRLAEADRPDAVFVLHDISAPVVASTILEAGLRIPEDVALVGFGNDVPFALDEVGLTTVGMDWRRIAETLASRLVARIEYPGSPREHAVVPAHLIVRGSCGAPKESWSGEQYQVGSATVMTRMPPQTPRAKTPRGIPAR